MSPGAGRVSLRWYVGVGLAGTFVLRVAGALGRLAVTVALAGLLGAGGYGRLAVVAAAATAVAAAGWPRSVSTCVASCAPTWTCTRSS